MPSILAIISKAVFEKEHGEGARLGAVLPVTAYHSKNPALASLAEGGDLHLVTVRGGALWLVAVLRRPRFERGSWVAATNEVPITDVTSALPRLRFANGKGIDVPPEKLGMALQTPRALTEADVTLLDAARAPSKASAKTTSVSHGAPKKSAAAAASTSQVGGIIELRMEQAIVAVREVASKAGPAIADEVLPWVDLEKWRSTEATSFWVYTYFLLMRFGEARHLKALRRPPPHKSHSEMHRWLLRNRNLTAKVIELRTKPKPQKWADEPLPKTRAQMMAHIAKRLGDPRWKQGKELAAFAAKPSFSLHGEEGLHVFAALLLHGEPNELAALKGLAKQEPIFAQILAARGLSQSSASSGDRDRGESLLRGVLEDPASDDARAVYADWLIEQGDPRGEMIAAQLAGKPTKIDDKSALAWAGDVKTKLRWRAPFANEKPFHTPRYARGFLSGAAVDSLDGQTAGSADWATIEVLDVHGKLDQIAKYDLRSLVVLGGLVEGDLDAVFDQPDLAARLVGIGLELRSADSSLVLDRLATLPRLRFLAIGRLRNGLTSVFTHPLIERIEVLAINDDKRVPKKVRDRATVLGTYLRGDRWLPHYDELMRRLAGTTP